MIDIKSYFKQTIQLVNSLTIKLDDEAFITNYRIYKLTGKNEEDPQLQKYYLNLQGIPHFLDKPIITYIPDIDSIGEINKDNINKYTTLKNKLLNFDKDFNNLVSNYPMQAILIRGILNPIDFTTAYTAENGTILYYNKNLVNENETNLIYKVETYIKNFLNRYHIKGYLIDELYMSGMLANLYNSLTLYILALRLRKVLTYQADQFHIDNHFYSFKKLVNLNNMFDKTTEINFYGMLNYVKTNVGQNNVFNYLTNYLLENAGIGVSNLAINKHILKINEDNIADNKKEFMKPDNKLIINKINENFTYNVLKDVSINLVNRLEKEQDYITIEKDLDKLEKEINEIINNISYIELNTKSFFLTINDLGLFYPNTILEIIFLNLNYFLAKNIIKVDQKFYLSALGITIDLNNKKLFYLFLKLLLNIREDTTNLKINEVSYDFVYTYIKNPNGLLNGLLSKDIILPIANKIVKILNSVANPQTTSEFYVYINTLKYILSFLWYLISNVNDPILNADLKVFTTRLFKGSKIKFENPIEIDKELGVSNLNNIHGELALDMLRKLFKDVFNLKVREVYYIIERLTKFVNLSKKVTSYSVQFLINKLTYQVKYLYKNSIMVGNGAVGIFDIDYAKFKLLETNSSFHDYIDAKEYLNPLGELHQYPYRIYSKTVEHKNLTKQILVNDEVSILNNSIANLIGKTQKTKIRDINEKLNTAFSIDELYYYENLDNNLEYKTTDLISTLPTGYKRHAKYDLYRTKSFNLDILPNGITTDNYNEYPEPLMEDKNKITYSNDFIKTQTGFVNKKFELFKNKELNSQYLTENLTKTFITNNDYKTNIDFKDKALYKNITSVTNAVIYKEAYSNSITKTEYQVLKDGFNKDFISNDENINTNPGKIQSYDTGINFGNLFADKQGNHGVLKTKSFTEYQKDDNLQDNKKYNQPETEVSDKSKILTDTEKINKDQTIVSRNKVTNKDKTKSNSNLIQNDSTKQSNTDNNKVQPNSQVYVEPKKIRNIPTNTMYTVED